MNTVKKITSLIIVFTLALAPLAPTFASPPSAYAAESPQSPSAPEKPAETEKPEQPETNTKPKPPAPEPPQQPESETNSPTPTPTPTPDKSTSSTSSQSSPAATNPQTTTSTGGSTQGDKQGDTSIATGDANAIGDITNNANTNLASTTPTAGASGTQATNTGNGSGSTNTNTIDDASSSLTNQNNSATVNNNANIGAKTGNNTIKDNLNGDVAITTGDANTALTVVNDVNTNIAGSDIVEFNVVDDHVGDIILDFSNPCATGGCVAGTPAYLNNSGNGANSTNTNDVTQTLTDLTFQNNDATIENNLILDSDSGHNKAKDNLGGDVAIVTGDANVSANVMNFANNNFAGNVLVGVVNIFGDLIGDIILPEQQTSGNPGTYAANAGNGADSTNFNNIDQSTLDQINQTNNANINNNLDLTAYTGKNTATDNISGDVSMTTGEANVVAQVLNIANTNIVGGTWWVVLVNEAGNWLGRIVGGSEGANYAGSEGTEFIVNPDGTITAYNAANGAGSTNTNDLTTSSTNTTTQANNANITNNLTLSANTGANQSRDNVGGNTSITTGDANIVASVVNFLNNNFVGGQVYLSVINVFGSWTGNFFGPSQTKAAVSDSNSTLALGGPQSPSNAQSPQNSGDSSEVQAATATQVQIQPNSVKAKINNFISQSAFNESPEQQVKGITSTPRKIIKFNLAWLILGLAIYLPIRNYKKLAALLPRHRPMRGLSRKK